LDADGFRTRRRRGVLNDITFVLADGVDDWATCARPSAATETVAEGGSMCGGRRVHGPEDPLAPAFARKGGEMSVTARCSLCRLAAKLAVTDMTLRRIEKQVLRLGRARLPLAFRRRSLRAAGQASASAATRAK